MTSKGFRQSSEEVAKFSGFWLNAFKVVSVNIQNQHEHSPRSENGLISAVVFIAKVGHLVWLMFKRCWLQHARVRELLNEVKVIKGKGSAWLLKTIDLRFEAKLYTLFFFYKNLLYKNVQDEINQNFKNILEHTGWESVKNVLFFCSFFLWVV